MKKWSGASVLLAVITSAVTGLVFAATSPTLKSTVGEQVGTEKSAAASQVRINNLDDETQRLLGEYRGVVRETDSLRRYNEQLAKQVKSQLEEMVSIQNQIVEIDRTNREILPLMQRMVETLEQFVALDLPFLPAERSKRIATLKDILGRADVTTAEKYRRILEAYQVELEYGRTIEAYEGALGEGEDARTVSFLRIGRVALMYQTFDGDETGYWDADEKAWEEDNGYGDAVHKGLKVARKQTAPDLLIAPVHAAPEAVESSKDETKKVSQLATQILAAVLMVAPAYAADEPKDSKTDAAAKSLEQLLEQTRNARQRESQANAAREGRFISDRNQQAGLLSQARGEKAAQEKRAADLGAQFDVNEKKLAEMQALLDAKGGNLGELFGVTRQVANDFSGVVFNSLITAQYPDRDEFVTRLAKAKKLPSFDELERFWFELQREMTATGQTVRFEGKVVAADGEPEVTEIVRIGGFNAVSGDNFLSYLPSERSFSVLPKQPDGADNYADDLQDETSGYVETYVDPTRGVMLAIIALRPTWLERTEQGELVGLIIIIVGLAGAVLSVIQFKYLVGVGRRVKAQLADLANPINDNPLGRVLLSFKGDGTKIEQDAEVVELRLSEAVLKEVPMLERYQSFLRLAVAAGPLLGLVGTVVGMIITFQSITESGGGDPKLMAAGISQAMIATVLGLGIAIPLLFMNALLQARSKGIVQILDEQSTGLLAQRLEEQRRA